MTKRFPDQQWPYRDAMIGDRLAALAYYRRVAVLERWPLPSLVDFAEESELNDWKGGLNYATLVLSRQVNNYLRLQANAPHSADQRDRLFLDDVAMCSVDIGTPGRIFRSRSVSTVIGVARRLLFNDGWFPTSDHDALLWEKEWGDLAWAFEANKPTKAPELSQCASRHWHRDATKAARFDLGFEDIRVWATAKIAIGKQKR